MAIVHFSLGKKGGIGKSQKCLFLIQGLLRLGRKVAAVDLDPATSTLVKYKGLEVVVIPGMLDKMGEIDPSKFDDLIEIANEREDLDDIVIDAGASNCIPFFNYLPRNQTFDLFREEGHRVLIHVMIKGGAEQAETLRTLKQVGDLFPTEEKIIWLNEYEHDLDFDGKGAEGISDVPEFIAVKDTTLAVFRLPYLQPKLEAAQIKKMNDKGILFSEVKKSGLFKLAEVKRLEGFADLVLGQIATGMKAITKSSKAKSEKVTEEESV